MGSKATGFILTTLAAPALTGLLALGCSDSSSGGFIPPAAPAPAPPPVTPPAPPPGSGAIPGFAGVTVAVDATGTGSRYDIGGGNNYGTELDDVPWQSLQPGDAVNIYHRATPYRHKVLLSEQGTAANPIVINGVSAADGTRPTIHAANAVSVNPTEWNPAYASALIMINKRDDTGTYGVNAEHYLIQNLRLTGVRATNSYTHDGVTTNYVDGGRAIWSAGGQHITLQGMVIEDNGSGVFIQAADDPGSLSKAWTIRGCKFENNGNAARDHQVYFQAVSDPGEYNIVEGCTFGAPTPGQTSVANVKMRSTGVVVRYNWFNSSHRTLDIVEAQDAIPDWIYQHYTPAQILSLYRSSYVYGNVFVMDFEIAAGQPAGRPLHFGADSFGEPPVFSTAGPANGQPGMRGYQSPTYFFFNTFYMRANSASLYRGSLFDCENNNSQPNPTSTPGSVEAWNNIFEFAGDTRIGIMNVSGTTNFLGGNLLHSSTLTVLAESDSFANADDPGDDPNVNVVYGGSLVTQSASFVDPGNASLDAKDFRLNASSPAIGQATALPAHLAGFQVQLQPADPTVGGAVLRPATNDLGALEH